MWPESQGTQSLLAAAGTGEPQAVEALWERHRAAVRRLIELRLDHKVRRRVDVSDVVQDTLVEANRRLAEYLRNPGLAFHLWLRQIAKDRVIDAHRRHRASAKRSVDREAGPPPGDPSSFDLVARLRDAQATPAAAAVGRELAARVEAAIGQLPEQDQEIIMMRHYEQLSNQDAAAALGLSEPAASMRYLRAVRRLKALLHEGDSASDPPPPR